MSKEFISRLITEKKIHPPEFLYDNINYLVIMGSNAYGVSNEISDMDVYGFCTPPKDYVFPQLRGIIPGFGRQIQKFDQYQEHHIQDPSKDREYDFSIYNIIRYFQLCMENNPNMIDSLFVPDRCVLHIDKVGQHLRENRNLFLHKGSSHKFRGYAHSQLAKIKNKSNSSNPKRAELIEKYGYDVKFSYHLVRLLLEAEQIANEHTLDIERNREVLKTIRNGEWTLDQLIKWFDAKVIQIEDYYAKSTLRNTPDEEAIKKVLIECLEMTYGDISSLAKIENVRNDSALLADLKSLISKYES